MSTIHAIPVIDAGTGWIAVDKPANISVHNDPGNDLISLMKNQIQDDKQLSERLGFGKKTVMGPVHRLDRETSGVMVLGLSTEICRFFSKQFEQRTAIKHYAALVHGEFECQLNKAMWSYSLGPEAGSRTNPRGKGPMVDCQTRVRLIEQSPHYALIECELLTGRKHQIRRHAKLAGHPVLGDTRYGSKKAVEYVVAHYGFDRLGLHSRSLTVTLPESGKKRTFEVAIPQKFLDIIQDDKKTGTQ